MATWDDIERAIGRGEIEKLDKETLEGFAAVEPRSSGNAAYHLRFEQAQLRIGRAIERINARERNAAETERHRELSERLESLKRAHWSVVPNFWMTLIILVLTAIGATAAVLAILR